jgi:hypothetical protein
MKMKDINKNWRKQLWRCRWNGGATLFGKIKRLERSLKTIIMNRTGRRSENRGGTMESTAARAGATFCALARRQI